MGRPPLALCVVRHGNRLDAADKRWHLTSPTPYDPPLTYSGWLQARALGERIGQLLGAEIKQQKASDVSSPRKRKRYQIVIHSSPFLRCIQTSTAISAGLAQNPLPVHDCPCIDQNPMHPDPSRSQSASQLPTPQVLTSLTNKPQRPILSVQKAILRLDACFGEWLSPEYFETITPPPSSAMMLGTAKAELLRREDYSSYPHFHAHHTHTSSGTSLGKLWNSPFLAANSDPSPLDDLDPLEKALDDKSSTTASETSPQRSVSFVGDDKILPPSYTPPTLSYSTSHNGPIPQGLVAHARDACLNIDYQWDSMRGPMSWGDGGSFGEEWTAMHKRFRKGLQSLVDWYSTAENPGEMVTKTVVPARMSHNSGECAVDDDDEECESIVIIVSHGAGCNALIGAITRKPVLMDVGVASLTLAVRRDETDEPGQTSPVDGDDGLVPLNETYDLRLYANTDHIRPSTSTTPSQSRSPSMANILNGQRGRFPSNSISSAINNFSYSDSHSGSRSSSASATFSAFSRSGNPSSSVPRTPSVANGLRNGGITVGSGVTSFMNTANRNVSSGLLRKGSVGLWSPFNSSRDDEIGAEEEKDDAMGMVLNFSHEKSMAISNTNPREPVRSSPLSITTSHHDHPSPQPTELSGDAAEADTQEEPQMTFGAGAGGLWGNPSPSVLVEAERTRDVSAHKRRWTVNERST